jgi:hypothetical protein
MAGVFENIDPHHPASVYPPPLVRGEDTLARRRGGVGCQYLEDVSHSSVLHVYKYFVTKSDFKKLLGFFCKIFYRNKQF